MAIKTKKQAFEIVAKSLREFGYPDATAQMVSDTWDAMQEGKPEDAMPHGIIGGFAYAQLNEVKEALAKLS
jgi:hypothetical protein